MNIYFSDFFGIESSTLLEYGALDITLVRDLPLFIDPFLIFANESDEYQTLHDEMLQYIAFLKQKSEERNLSDNEVVAWYKFSEVKQNWLGYSKIGNSGRGLGKKFGRTMADNMHVVFDDLGNEIITKSSHIEKATLFGLGVGRDSISDFCTNLIKSFLLEYTQRFALENISDDLCRKFKVEKVYFDYKFDRWMPKTYTLPVWGDEYVLLTPKEILTKDKTWINSSDLRDDFYDICNSVGNETLRAEINSYIQQNMPIPKDGKNVSKTEEYKVIASAIRRFPEVIKWYVKSKEENVVGAKNLSQQNVDEIEGLFISSIKSIVKGLKETTGFYGEERGSYERSIERANCLKHYIEDRDGWRSFYHNDKPIKRESDLQMMFDLTWSASSFDVNKETNNGRGPSDFVVSKGSKDKTTIEIKLASSSSLRDNLAKQAEIYMQANGSSNCVKIIMYFNESEYKRLYKVLNELDLHNTESVILIDASPKISASKA